MRSSQKTYKQKAIGEKKWLIPDKILKITYKSGAGKTPQYGDIVKAYTKCELINGNQIFSKTIKQFTIGHGRLIQGLEIGLKQAHVNQKFTLMVCPEYAYLYDDTQSNGVIPISQKLIFQFEIIQISSRPFQKKDDVDKIIFLMDLHKQADSLFQNNHPYKAIKVLDYMCELTSSMRKFSKMHDTAIVKKANILCYLQRYQDAIQINKIAVKNQLLQKAFLVHYKIYLKMGKKDNAKEVMRRYHLLYGYNAKCRRIYVEFLKEVMDFDTLRSMEGYNFQQDKIYKIVRKEPQFYPFLTRGFFF